uniref:Uncharacterized protein n=1 Tax=Cajanus cajan TaxID=3821 RepID=A0A151UFG8_CAJCA
MGRNISVLIGKFFPHIPEKCKDPGTFYVPYIIGNNKFKNVMLDLGASINVMPLSIFKSLLLDLYNLRVWPFSWPIGMLPTLQVL